ncbi:hypothetical protein CLV58_105190 [Spirosoma oryzae]|uniref:Uncharacterized protein n=1 Tax=Spirosoma oryzae TaxID=1469603 RepID=A0A2T0T8M6_9BACT|nr:hypothetical protein [Spirosoma oryzae]PRY41988.1 hypothetical protein CLV58_105190 [Spirosoma oryzae]
MKSVTSLFLGLLLLVGSLFPQTDVEEVYKIPGLVSHYQLHKQSAGQDFDFWQFLDMHYNASSTHAKLPHDGVKIPLYNHLSLGFVFTLPMAPKQEIVSEPAVVMHWPQVYSAYQNLYAYQNTSFLFQPPQLG